MNADTMARARLYALAGIVGLAIIALVVLSLGHAETGPILTLLAPLAAALITLAGVERNRAESADRHAESVAKLDQITHQTNGVLTARIQAAVAEALAGNPPAPAPADSSSSSIDELPELDPDQAPGG